MLLICIYIINYASYIIVNIKLYHIILLSTMEISYLTILKDLL